MYAQYLNDLKSAISEEKVSPNEKFEFFFGEIPLLSIAILMGEPELIKLCLQKQGNVNLTGRQGISPIHIAAFKGDLETITLLFKYGKPNVNARDNEGNGDSVLQRLISVTPAPEK